jgi:NADH dehydrogenase
MHVVVLGSGYAGVTLARKLEASLPAAVDLTVVDDSESHLVQHEVHRAIRRPSITDAIEVPLESLFERCEIVTARVEAVETDTNRVVLDSGETLDFDYAGLCLGAETAYYDLPGVEEYGLPLKSVDDAETIRQQALDAIDSGEDARSVVGGAGLSGVQVAGELATLAEEEGAADRIEVVVREQLASVAPAFPEAFQSAVADELAARDIEVRTETAVAEATDSTIETRQASTGTERSVDYDLFVWTGGIGGSAAMAGDRPVVQADLRLTNSTFALGDAARIVDADGEAVPASASAAIRSARVAADNITTLVEWELGDGQGFEPRLEQFRFDAPGWIVSVGDGAVAQVGPKVATGKPAKALKASVGAGYLSSVRAIRQATELVGEELNA